MKQSLEDFKTDILKKRGVGRKKVKISNCLGIYNIYKEICKNNWYNIGRPLTRKEFYAIIRNINKLLAEELANGNNVKLPARMGVLELVKHEVGASIRNGKLKVSYPIDWSKTIKLWYEDKEAYANKILIRYNTPYVYKIKYRTYPASYNNKSFYQFALNRKIKLRLRDNINEGKTDTLWLKR